MEGTNSNDDADDDSEYFHPCYAVLCTAVLLAQAAHTSPLYLSVDKEKQEEAK